MRKRLLTFFALWMLLCTMLTACGREEAEEAAVPDTIVEEASVPEEPEVTEEVEEEPEADEEEDEEEPAYPYWWELHDYNADQEVLAQDGEFKNLSLQPGNEPDELYVTWFSKSSSRGKVTFETDGFFSNITAKATTQESISVPGYYRNSALIKGLKSNTTYTYHLTNGSSKSPTYTYETGDLESTDFTFTIAGDPEIGLGDPEVLPGHRSIWRVVLNRMKSQIEDSSFLVTTGDQVADAGSSEHYDYFLDNSVLYSTPLVPVMGNHDVGTGYFGDHFSLPNQSALGTSQGNDGDYWFVKGNALFMVINTLTVMEKDIHEQFVEEAIAANPDAKWRVIISHYSPITMVERYQGTREDVKNTFGYMTEAYDIDLVLSGHDHIYTRGRFLDIDGDPIMDEEVTDVYDNPEHTVYVIFGAATDALLRTPDEDYPWSAVSVQNGIPQLSEAHVTEDSFTITTHDADSWEVIDSFTIYKD